MTAAREASMTISLTKSLSYCGVSRTAWYYERRPRNPAIDGRMESLIIGGCQDKAHVRDAQGGGPARQAAGGSRKPQEGIQDIPETGVDRVQDAQIRDNPLRREAAKAC